MDQDGRRKPLGSDSAAGQSHGTKPSPKWPTPTGSAAMSELGSSRHSTAGQSARSERQRHASQYGSEASSTRALASESGRSESWYGAMSSDRQFSRTNFTAPRPQRRFAPGLAPRSKKIDPYDPHGIMEPQDDYSLMKEKNDAQLIGTWTTFDPDTGKRSYDRQWHAEKKRSTERAESGVPTSRPEPFDISQPPSFPRAALSGQQAPADEKAKSSVHATPLDARFENPDLDVDPDIREKFRGIGQVLEERVAPLSEFQQRNRGILPTRVAPSAMKVIIGDEVVKTLEPKFDNRGQFQDRFGNYLGPNLGQMKKHLVEDRAALIKLRNEEMVRATQDKRKWEAVAPGEREEILAKRRAQAEAFRMGPGAAACDIFEYTDIPADYISVRSGWSNAARHVGRTLRSSGIASSATIRPEGSIASGVGSPSSNIKGSQGSSARYSGTTSSTSAGRGPHSHGRSNPSFSSRRTTNASASDTSSHTDITPSLGDPGPELFPLDDVQLKIEAEPNDELADQYEALKTICSTRGRIVAVTLVEPVHFSPAAVVDKIFGGIIQEVQFHPRQRQALVVFVFPGEAEAFVKHVAWLRARDRLRYGRLQIRAEWYRGTEIAAIYPIQRRIFTEVLASEARRVIKLSGIAAAKKREQLADEMKNLLRTILVKVALVRESRRYVQAEEGNAAIVEFVSIKDAAEAMAAFKAGRVKGYEKCGVSWLSDPCDRGNKDGKFEGCGCANCGGEL